MLGTGASAQDFMVQQRLAGANMQVEITCPAGGMAAVQGDTISGQGLYDIPVHSANVLETIGTADPSNPRVDQVILEVQDNVLDASGGNLARTRVLPGTPTGGANLTNRTGAAVLPGSALLLADVLVGAGAGSITNSVIRDRRKWARGASVVRTRTSGDTSAYSSGVWGDVDNVNLKPRIECSGAPVKVRLAGVAASTTAGTHLLGYAIDGDLTGSTISPRQRLITVALSTNYLIELSWTITPAPGSHLFAAIERALSGNLILIAGNTSGNGSQIEFGVEEIVRQDAANNTVTTG